MADRLREQLPARLLLLLRLTFAVVCVISLVLGYFGLHSYIIARPPPLLTAGHGPADLIYYDAELFFLQSTPIAGGGPYPWPLAVARFAAPCVSAYTVFEFGVALSAGRIRRARVRRYRGHAIVCGSTRVAAALASRLREDHRVVVTVEASDGDAGAADAVHGDATALSSLVAAGVWRAAAVYSCLEDSHRNIEVANSVEQIRAGRRAPVRVHALVTDLELCLALKARRWTTAGADRLRVDFFNADELAAQQVVRSDEAVFADEPPRVAIVGTGAFGRSVLVELARQWLIRWGKSADPASAMLVGAGAREAVALTAVRYPFLEQVCVVDAHDGPLQDLLDERTRAGLPALHRLYLCPENEGDALRAALTLVAGLSTAFDAIVVRLDRLSGMAKTFDRSPGSEALFDALDGRLRIVDVAESACDPATIGFDLAEVLARTGHQRYLQQRLTEGATMGSTTALTGWDSLPEEFRASSRAQAIDIGRKLAAIGALLVPRTAPVLDDFRYGEWEIEFLARQEHDRWWAERAGQGWRYDFGRDDTARRHPDMVPWTALTEDKRERDRQAIRSIPAMLAEVGLAIVRVGPPAGRGEVLVDSPEPFG